jgi:hypothetical protein
LVNDGLVLTDSASALPAAESGTPVVVFSPSTAGVYGQSQTLSTTTLPTGDTVGFAVDASSGAGVCTTANSVLSYTGIGTCVVDATLTQTGSTTAATAEVAVTVTVGAPPVVVGVPGPPVGLGGAGGDSMVVLSWSAPASDGGSPVTGYVVYETAPGANAGIPADCVSVPSPADSCTVNGLIDGSVYAFNV